jgi:hypothetical protein
VTLSLSFANVLPEAADTSVMLLLQVQADDGGLKAVRKVISDAVSIWLGWLKAGASSSASKAEAVKAAVREAAGLDQQQVGCRPELVLPVTSKCNMPVSYSELL